ncbi:addiction module toxin, HicA family [Thiocystis minor]|nr:addiction module toxin, HicA family [Thiocystis minor]
MKRTEFIAWLEKQDCRFLRHGSRHDIYLNPTNGKKQPVPRHAEIDNQLVKHIKKQLAL